MNWRLSGLPMKNLRREEWEFAKAKGRDWFVVFHGILKAGFPMAVIFLAVEIFRGLDDKYTPPGFFPGLAVKGFFIALAFGLFWGRLEWNRHRRLYED